MINEMEKVLPKDLANEIKSYEFQTETIKVKGKNPYEECIIYKVVNPFDDICYIGNSNISFEETVKKFNEKKFRKSKNKLLYQYYKHHGWYNAEFVLLERLHCYNVHQLDARTMLHIKKLNPFINRSWIRNVCSTILDICRGK